MLVKCNASLTTEELVPLSSALLHSYNCHLTLLSRPIYAQTARVICVWYINRLDVKCDLMLQSEVK